MSRFELDAMVNELRELRRMAAEIETEIAALQDAIKSYMTDTGMYVINGTDYKVTWNAVESLRFDKAAMIQAFGQECYDSFCKPVNTRRFVLA